jgi:hypothetical protein
MKTKKLSVQFNVVVPVDVTHKQVREGLVLKGIWTTRMAGKLIAPMLNVDGNKITSIQVNDVEKK